MKKLISSLILSCIIFLGIKCFIDSNKVSASNINNSEMIYVNNVKLNDEVYISESYNEIIMPLRAILEALGSEVYWEESTGNIYFNYSEINYVCKFVSLNSNSPEEKSILVSKNEYKDSTKTSDHIMLNLMGASGSYCMIDNKTYLYKETGIRLFEALGCKVEVDLDTNIVRISNILAPNIKNSGMIYVNNVKLNDEFYISASYNEIIMPLRTILEALGSEVYQEESTGNIYFNYSGINYICKFVPLNSNFPEEKKILISNIEYKDSTKTSDHIMLNPMGASGSYCMVDNKTYLYRETGIRLFEALGCKVEVDSDTNIVRISN